MIKNIKILILLLASGLSYAQQDSQFTQYMYNTVSINPAYAGSRETFTVFALHRSQWIGLDGAPQTNNISINTSLGESNFGIGVSIINDKIGITDENNLAIDFSYAIETSENYKLSFGLKGSGNLLNVDFNKLNQSDSNDSNLKTNIENKFMPNIGVGLYLYSDNTYLGFSVPNVLETKHFNIDKTSGSINPLAKQDIEYYLTAGHVFDFNRNLKFKPSILVKGVQGAPVSIDLSSNFIINEKFVTGVSYRLNTAFSAMVGIQTSQSWFIGYSYDMDTTGLSKYNSGSHELFLRYELFKRISKLLSPRIF